MHPCRTAVLAVYAAEALLLAFSLKLRVSAALAGHRGPRPAAPAVAAALGLDDSSFHKAASFLGQCMPTYATTPGGGRSTLKGPAGAALQRLAQDGLAWVPTCCNLATMLCFGLCVALNAEITGSEPAAILLLAPVLLLLAQDPLLLRWLEHRRRYLPPVAVVCAYLAGAALWQLAGEASEMGVGGAGMAVYIGKNVASLAAALPCQVALLMWLWGGYQTPVLRLLALAPLNLLALWASDMDEVRVSAGVSLAAVAVQLLSAQQSQKQGRALI